MTGPWLPRFSCPECRTPLPDGGRGLSCRDCGRTYARDPDGLFRFLAAHRATAAEPFLAQYRIVRAFDGYRSFDPEYYRALPRVPAGDARQDEWRVRCESFGHLRRYALPEDGRPPLRVLDLGAGCGWLSHRLASLGHHPVAVDCADDAADGLRACHHYPVGVALVQADFHALPFEPGQFDLAIFNGSLHYSPDPAGSLAEAARALAPDGALVVMDSPMFSSGRHGTAMLHDERTRIIGDTGVDITRPGVGFLTFDALDRASRRLGRRGWFVPSRGSVKWRIRRQLAWLRLGRAPAAFGVWIAR